MGSQRCFENTALLELLNRGQAAEAILLDFGDNIAFFSKFTLEHFDELEIGLILLLENFILFNQF